MPPLYNILSRISEHIPTTRKQIYLNLQRNSTAVVNIVLATLMGISGLTLVHLCGSISDDSISSNQTNRGTPSFQEPCLLSGSLLTVTGSILMITSTIQTIRAIKNISKKAPLTVKKHKKRIKFIYNLSLEIFGGVIGVTGTLTSYICYASNNQPFSICNSLDTLSYISGAIGLLQGSILLIIICKKHDGICVKGKKIKIEIIVHEPDSAIALKMYAPDYLTKNEVLSISHTPLITTHEPQKNS